VGHRPLSGAIRDRQKLAEGAGQFHGYDGSANFVLHIACTWSNLRSYNHFRIFGPVTPAGSGKFFHGLPR